MIELLTYGGMIALVLVAYATGYIRGWDKCEQRYSWTRE